MPSIALDQVVRVARDRLPVQVEKVKWNDDIAARDPQVRHELQIIRAIEKIRHREITHGKPITLIKSGLSLCESPRHRLPLEIGGKQLPKWKRTSPWFKLQMGVLVLADRPAGYFQLGLHFHPVLLGQFDGDNGRDKLAGWLRNRVRRELNQRLGQCPEFYLVCEDRNKGSREHRVPHFHGAVAAVPLSLPKTSTGAIKARYRRMAARDGIKSAEEQYGVEELHKALRTATGNMYKRPPPGWDFKGGRTYRRKAFGTHSNYVSYAYKNVKSTKSALGRHRVVKSNAFTSSARALWESICKNAR